MLRLCWISVLSALIIACNFSHEKRYQGYVVGENIYVASPFAGAVINLCVARGQLVKKDQILFTLDQNPQLFERDQAFDAWMQAKNTLMDLKSPKRQPEIDAIIAQIGQADAKLALSELRVQRNQTLYDKKVMDKDTLDAAKENMQESKFFKQQNEANLVLAKEGAREGQILAQAAQTKAAYAKYREAQWEVLQKTQRATIDGVIFDTYYHQGEYVSAQKPVVSLLAPENMYVEFFVTANEIGNTIRLGEQIRFICYGCAEKNIAVINYISPTAEYAPPLVYTRANNDKLVFRVKARLINPKLFKSGQPVEVIV